MFRATQVLLKSRQSNECLLDLTQILQSEIKHELSTPLSQGNQNGSLGNFVVHWDAPNSQDVVLRKICESGEEVAVSALLGSCYLTDFLMKVFVKKPGLDSLLQFDCNIYEKGSGGSDFYIRNAYYLRSPTCLAPSAYRGPKFWDLDPELQKAFKEYLVAKGINASLTNFILQHLREKEKNQYVNWLQKIESLIAKKEPANREK